jgi:restriction system protein
MANVTRRRTGEFLRTLFELLVPEASGMKAGPLIKQVAQLSKLTEWEKGQYPSGGQRFEKILRFGSVDCVKAGWLQKTHGVWSVTESGQKAFKQYKDPEAFYKEACRLYEVWKQERDAVAGTPPLQSGEQELEVDAEKVNFTFEEAEEQARDQIEKFLHSSDPFEFQQIVADLLTGMGYHVSWISPPGKDGGVDIVAYSDEFGTAGPRIKVQVKRWQTKVDSDGLKAFIATISDTDVGIFVCLAGFTKDAAEYARNQEKRRMTLIDVRRFVELWIGNYSKLGDSARQRFPLVPIYFLAPKE